MKKVLNILRQIVGWFFVLVFVLLAISEFSEKGYLSGSLFILVAIFNIPQVQSIVFKEICKIAKSGKKSKNYILTVSLQILSLIICFVAIMSSPMGKSDDSSKSQEKPNTTKVVDETQKSNKEKETKKSNKKKRQRTKLKFQK